MGLQKRQVVDVRPPARRIQYLQPRWIAFVCLAAAILILGTISCGGKAPVVDRVATASGPATGTISGTVRGPQGTSPVEGRTVEVVNLETGERQRAATDPAGAFAFKLKPGKYRIELTLRDGESLARQPGIIDLEHRDADAQANFEFGTVRVSRPRGPAYRLDDGLGSPIA